uniref:Uncharacterized protein n=1 Tax=Glossina pallidipes TaxID=7398 RepID=A0A1B0A9K6_GLOPL
MYCRGKSISSGKLHTINDEFERIYGRGLMDLGYGSNVLSNELFLVNKKFSYMAFLDLVCTAAKMIDVCTTRIVVSFICSFPSNDYTRFWKIAVVMGLFKIFCGT